MTISFSYVVLIQFITLAVKQLLNKEQHMKDFGILNLIIVFFLGIKEAIKMEMQ